MSRTNNACVACAAGTTNDAGDDASGSDTTCDVTTCAVNVRLEQRLSVCPAGTTNDAGDDASGSDTTVMHHLCYEQYVSMSELCGFENDAGDDASGSDTSCSMSTTQAPSTTSAPSTTTTSSPQRLAPSTTTTSSPRPSTTTQAGVLCAENEYVSNNACIPYAAGTTNRPVMIPQDLTHRVKPLPPRHLGLIASHRFICHRALLGVLVSAIYLKTVPTSPTTEQRQQHEEDRDERLGMSRFGTHEIERQLTHM